VYIEGQEDKDYFTLLNDVINPITEGLDGIEKFFFFRYHHDNLHYIRLRINAHKSIHKVIKYMFDKEVSWNHIIKHEDSDYDEVEDIVGRFGQTRYKEIIDMCELASKLALSFASGKETYDPHPKGQGGVAGIVHLISNTLNYKVKLDPNDIYEVQDWDRISKRYGSVCP
jgi:hypothetical protein